MIFKRNKINKLVRKIRENETQLSLRQKQLFLCKDISGEKAKLLRQVICERLAKDYKLKAALKVYVA